MRLEVHATVSSTEITPFWEVTPHYIGTDVSNEYAVSISISNLHYLITTHMYYHCQFEKHNRESGSSIYIKENECIVTYRPAARQQLSIHVPANTQQWELCSLWLCYS
jgi:predicted NAD-dependent protein-ADP-ribosyltransferase YbiA (DUF1768 family)